MPTPDRGAPSAAGFRRMLLSVLSATFLAATAVLIWLAAGRTGDAGDLQAEREAVMSQSQQFLLRVNTYGPSLLDDQGQMPDYREGVRELITSKFATSFDQSVTIAEQLVKAGAVERTAEIHATGVTTIDDDSARVLVAGQIDQTYVTKDKSAEQPRQQLPFRLEVSLVKVDGKWLVDDYDPVGGASASGEPTP